MYTYIVITEDNYGGLSGMTVEACNNYLDAIRRVRAIHQEWGYSKDKRRIVLVRKLD